MRAILALLLASCVILCAGAAPPVRPIVKVEHVVLISVDGLRPDLALRANAPTLRMLLHDGAFTFWARTTDVAITLPSHTSMLTGVSPEKHGIYWNADRSFDKALLPKHPTVLEMATRAGYTTAMIAGKSKFSALDRPGTITHVSVPSGTDSEISNEEVARNAEAIIASSKPALTFVHFPDVDAAGHEFGWGSQQQIAAIERTDRAIAGVLSALDQAGVRASTVVIVSADHGGAGMSHGANDPRSRYIPWIIAGPGVKHGYDLAQLAQLEVRTEDSAATICYLLGLPLPGYFDGRAVLAALAH